MRWDGVGANLCNYPMQPAFTLTYLERHWSWGYRILLAVLLTGVSNFWGFSSPNGFVKCASMKQVTSLPLVKSDSSRYFINPDDLLRHVPRSTDEEENAKEWMIDPDLRTQQVFEQGVGNCSFRSKALARVLQKMEVPYSIVWIMHAKDVRNGAGHTVIECPIQLGDYQGSGIIDMLEGGVPYRGLRPVMTEDLLQHLPIDELHLRTFNSAYDSSSRYYGEFLVDAAIGSTTSEDMNQYMDWMAQFYVPLGSYRLEKGLYVVGAMVVGVYPRTLITATEFARFDGWFRMEILLASSMIWSVRLLGLIVAVDMIRWLARVQSRRKLINKAT